MGYLSKLLREISPAKSVHNEPVVLPTLGQDMYQKYPLADSNGAAAPQSVIRTIPFAASNAQPSGRFVEDQISPTQALQQPNFNNGQVTLNGQILQRKLRIR